jgi:hypothetical protein
MARAAQAAVALPRVTRRQVAAAVLRTFDIAREHPGDELRETQRELMLMIDDYAAGLVEKHARPAALRRRVGGAA